MKHQHSRNHQWLRPALFGLALACTTSLSQAQTAQDKIISQFDDGVGGGLWGVNYGTAPMVIEYDPLENRGPGANPGAMKCTINFDLCTLGTGGNQRDFERVLGETLDLTKYTKLHFSVKVDPSSSHLSDWGGGAFGNMRPHVRLSSWGGDVDMAKTSDNSVWVGSDAYGAWIDYSKDIEQTANLSTKVATGILGIDIWSGWGNCAAPIGHTNTVIFWMDNIWFEFNTNTAPTPPPIITNIAKAGPGGAQITLNSDGDQWQREAISTPAGTGPYFWASQGAYPVSYSYTISEFPDRATHNGYESHIYIGNGDTTANQEVNGAPDWNCADLFLFRVENTAGGARAQIQWKTNAPSSNATNIPVVVDAATAIGTWTVTFTSATDGTLTGPGISPTNFTIPADAVANNFNPGTSFIQFGAFKNDGANDGHNNNARCTIDQIQFNGASTINDNLDGPTLTNNYAWRRTSSTVVQYLPPGAAWAIDWSLPDSGFNLETAAAVTGPWSAASLINKYQAGGRQHAMVAQSTLPSVSSTFFRLIKRPFTKLQVLLPGESNAPNTVSGKTGTPDPQTAGVPFNITVNACDAVWNVVSSTDTVNITSTDTVATLPADAALSLGTGTFAVTLNAAGTWTVTATDVTDGTKTANSSTAITIP